MNNFITIQAKMIPTQSMQLFITHYKLLIVERSEKSGLNK